jgi:hypothetical protein
MRKGLENAEKKYVKRYGKYGRNSSWIVKRLGKYRRKLLKDMKKMEERQVE